MTIKNDMVNRNALKDQFVELEKIENEFANYMMNNKIRRIQMAKRMKEKGIDIITIQEITKLTEEEINAL